MSLARKFLILTVGLAALWGRIPILPVAAGAEVTTEYPAEKLRKGLDKTHDLDIKTQALDTFVNDLRLQTGVNFVIDQTAVPPLYQGGPGTSPYAHIQVGGEVHGKSVRAAVQELLRGLNLAPAIVGDTVFLTTTERVAQKQFTQPVRVNLDSVPLKSAVRQLIRMTAVNIVLDPRQAKAAEAGVTATLDDVPLESALTVLADQADLGVARIGNILYVTTPDRVEKLHKAAAIIPAPTPPPNPAGLPPGIGLAGIGGVIGFGGAVAPGAGLAGGGGLLGGAAGGPAKPVPLTPDDKEEKKEPAKKKTDPPPPPPPAAKPADPGKTRDAAPEPDPADRARSSRLGRDRFR
jgi:hypothetical protein